jgi:phage gpG-like protein
MVTVSVEVFGDKIVERELLRFSHAAENMRPAGQEFMDYMRGIEREQFNTQGASGSGGWAPLKPATVAQKARRGHDPRILRATGALFGSLTSRGGPNHLEKISANEWFYGTSDPKAKFHQKGTRRMPRRPVIEFSERNRRDVVKIVQRHLIGEGR